MVLGSRVLTESPYDLSRLCRGFVGVAFIQVGGSDGLSVPVDVIELGLQAESLGVVLAELSVVVWIGRSLCGFRIRCACRVLVVLCTCILISLGHFLDSVFVDFVDVCRSFIEG